MTHSFMPTEITILPFTATHFITFKCEITNFSLKALRPIIFFNNDIEVTLLHSIVFVCDVVIETMMIEIS